MNVLLEIKNFINFIINDISFCIFKKNRFILFFDYILTDNYLNLVFLFSLNFDIF
jgi:hypothetical protein